MATVNGYSVFYYCHSILVTGVGWKVTVPGRKVTKYYGENYFILQHKFFINQQTYSSNFKESVQIQNQWFSVIVTRNAHQLLISNFCIFLTMTSKFEENCFYLVGSISICLHPLFRLLFLLWRVGMNPFSTFGTTLVAFFWFLRTRHPKS